MGDQFILQFAWYRICQRVCHAGFAVVHVSEMDGLLVYQTDSASTRDSLCLFIAFYWLCLLNSFSFLIIYTQNEEIAPALVFIPGQGRFFTLLLYASVSTHNALWPSRAEASLPLFRV